MVDINGDSRLDLVMNSEVPPQDGSGGLIPLVYRAEGDGYVKHTFREFAHESCFPAARVRALSVPFTFAFVDLNDD